MIPSQGLTEECSTPEYLDEIETADRVAIESRQLERMRRVVALAFRSPFYAEKFRDSSLASATEIPSLRDLDRVPFTEKAEFVSDQAANPPFGSRLTEPISNYRRVHVTSGTSGHSLRMLDTADSWEWWLRCWERVFRAAGVGPNDRVFAPFSFGPFVGFWAGFEAARLVGAMQIPGGGQTTQQRVQQIYDLGATVLLCTPTYALRMAEVAREMGIEPRASPIRLAIHAGEPGANIPATRERLEESWDMEVFDHPGATEVGAWGFECQSHMGVHLNEAEFFFEVLEPGTDKPAREGELVITNLGRAANPAIRYRTGDRVRLADSPCACGRKFRRLDGGVIGRIDDMLVVRGVNLYPSAIENVVRKFDGIDEFTIELFREREMDELEIRLETNLPDPAGLAQRLGEQLHVDLGFRPRVSVVESGTLPRFELKARRVFDRRST